MSWSDDRFKSTFHRVKAPSEPEDYWGERYSIACKLQSPPLVRGVSDCAKFGVMVQGIRDHRPQPSSYPCWTLALTTTLRMTVADYIV
jgi:hypothetical protein